MTVTEMRREGEHELTASAIERISLGVALCTASFALEAAAALEPFGCAGLVNRYRAEAAAELSPRAMPVGAQLQKAAGAHFDQAGRMDYDVLINIARTHRAHERYYTQHMAETAASLLREANVMRTVADVWLGPEPQVRRYSDAVAGCDDLNAVSAITAIGVLFMEGEGEPREIAGLKARLRGASAAQQAAGSWLFAKTRAALEREGRHLLGTLREAAEARFATIGVNWRGSQECVLAGRLLAMALDRLDALDVRPAAIRASRKAAGQAFLEASWLIVMAAQLQSRFSISLADNDRNWTTYLRVLETSASGGLPTDPASAYNQLTETE